MEETIRSLIEGPNWQQRPVQFLVLDLSLVAGIDMSSAEAFVRVHRLLNARFVTLVFCGFESNSPVWNALRTVEVVGAPGVELFSTFNDAIECGFFFLIIAEGSVMLLGTENEYLHSWFTSQKVETTSDFSEFFVLLSIYFYF